jgi:hypothetical protein
LVWFDLIIICFIFQQYLKNFFFQIGDTSHPEDSQIDRHLNGPNDIFFHTSAPEAIHHFLNQTQAKK